MNGAGSSELGDFPLFQLQRVIEVRDRFEAELLSGRSPLIESYLTDMVDLDRLTLLRELLSLELVYRGKSGWQPAPGEYLERFPEYETLIASVFEEVSFSTIGSGTPLGTVDPESTEEPGNPDGPTIAHESSVRSEREDQSATLGDQPKSIGRYRVELVLGEGGFGRVFKAFDTELNRWVAIKVPHSSRIRTSRDLESYFTEARILASLDHPGIVPVFDVGRTEEGLCFIVSKLIEGLDLAARLKQGRPTYGETASQIAMIAEAAHHAHTRNLVHRDIKARNILIDGVGRPYLTDFGLALKEEDFGKGPVFAGTPVYMSPEQARGEGHRVDGRSDIFSLGVVFYEMLAGTRPFKGGTWEETIERIKTLEVRPPRQLDDSIPRELERICLKALAKRVSDRYTTALDMADDLRHALAQLHPSSQESRPGLPQRHEAEVSSLALHIVPKGLRCFEAEDADFFLRLLPGPRDRDDLPDSLRFWKSRIEATEDERAFRVGLVYGPSGCGKSSFVKAGLVPRLEASITSILIEATPDETESRLEAALRRRFDTLPADTRLPELLAMIRRGAGVADGGKVLLVIDQFEQWLHANRSPEDSDLVHALRQCDGVRLQCLLIVRDDFWMSVTRFMQELEVRLVEGQNSAAVDLFSERHAKKVLAAFGRAFEALPADPARPKKDQLAFIDRAVAGLAQDGKVVCVQLSLFAEMVKNKPWTLATLRDVGGTQGIGTTFLDETFSAATSPPEYRRHQRAVREVLRALLPEKGTEIKGHMRSRGELLDASGYAGSPHDFDELLLILDKDLRLITPTDPQGEEPGEGRGLETHYQLTHDYLVPSLRDWLTKKQRETRRGRAEIRLAERTALWGAKPERRQLPSFLEWLEIRIHTQRTRWNERETQMMRAATRDHTIRIAQLLFVLALATVITVESYTYLRAAVLLDHLFAADTAKVPEIVSQLTSYRRWTDPRLRERKMRSQPGSQESLHASLALLPVDRSQELDLIDQLLSARSAHVSIIRDALAPGTPEVKANLWRRLEDVSESKDRRLRLACALALYDPESRRWDAVAPDIASILTGEDVLSISHWSDLLRPIREKLLIPLKDAFLTQRDNQRGYVAASLLAEYAHDRTNLLFELIQQADPRQLRVLLSTQTAQSKPRLVAFVRQILSDPPPPRANQEELDKLAQQKANAALVLAALDQSSALGPFLENRPDPRLRTYLILRIPGFETDPTAIFHQFRYDPVPTRRQAMVLCLGEFDDHLLSLGIRNTLIPKLLAMYGEDPDPGVHSAIRWLLGRWARGAQTRRADLEWTGKEPKPGQGWRINSQGHTMVLVEGPLEFAMGSPDDEAGRDPTTGFDETQHTRRIRRTFEIASTEVTVRQFFASPFGHTYHQKISPDEDCPMNQVTLFYVAKYCRWLSEQEHIPESEMCFPKIEEIKSGFQMPPDYLSRTGYRPPTEAEWEAACRAGTTTSRFYGSNPRLLERYAWAFPTSKDRMHPVATTMPNPLGLFDMFGNAYERCLGPNPKQVKYPRGTVDDNVLNVGLPNVLFGESALVIRGGACHRSEEVLRAACRNLDEVKDPNRNVGFRIARTLKTFAPPPSN